VTSDGKEKEGKGEGGRERLRASARMLLLITEVPRISYENRPGTCFSLSPVTVFLSPLCNSAETFRRAFVTMQ
jgi:hypothetical protein